MAKQSCLIKELDITKKNCTLTARATRIWEVRYKPINLSPDSMDMVFVDEQGGQIQAVIRKDLVKHFKEDLQEGFIYTLSHFIVGNNKRTYNQVQNDFIIWFTPLTSVILRDENVATIPHHKFNLFPLNRLADRVNNNVILTEAIGQLIGIENKIHGTTASPERRTIHIRDDKGDTIKATLWGDRADLVPYEIADPMQPHIIIITTTRVNVYKGSYQLNSTNATRVHTNLNIPEVDTFKQAITNIPATEIAHIQVSQPESFEESMTKNRRTIKELQELHMENDRDKDLNASYTCVGRIVMVLEEECGWRYRSCNVCKSKIDETEYCVRCDFNPPFPVDRYRLVVTIHDGDASLNVGLFDKDVEKILGKPMAAMDKISKQVNGKQKVSKELQQCIGKECTLKVKLNKNGYIQDLTATRVLDVQNKRPTLRPTVKKESDPELEADISLALERSLQDEKARQSTKRTAEHMAAHQNEDGKSSEDPTHNKDNNSEKESTLEDTYNFEEQPTNNIREGKEIAAEDPTNKLKGDKKQRLLSDKTSPNDM